MWVQRGGVGAFLDLAPSYLSSYTQTFSRVSMLVKPSLGENLREVHGYIQRIVELQSPTAAEQLVEKSLDALAAFQRAAKEELGIG